MKTKHFIAIMMLCLIFGSCDNKKQQQQSEINKLRTELEAVKKENQQLKNQSKATASSIEAYKNTLNEIEKNLAAIDESKMAVEQLRKEGAGSAEAKDKIAAHINNIRALMENSKMKIMSLDKNLVTLRKKYDQQSDQVLQLDQQIKNLTADLIAKERSMEEMNAEIASLNVKLQEQINISNDLNTILNRAYLVVGENKKLKDMGVVTTEGGFIGLGKVKVLNANMDQAQFTKIEKDKTETIDINAKKAKLISRHPEGSYEFMGDKKVDKLVIKDKNAFWKDGNYLVVEVSGV